MTFISYAQNFEDVMLWRALKHVENGFYIDVGASDPEADSVTKAFYDRGWHGINVEPLPEYHRRLGDERPRDINLPIAAGDNDGELSLFDIPAVRGWASPDQGVATDYQNNGFEVKEMKVAVQTLARICEEHVQGEIHFLKIDVECFETEVIRGMDFQRWRPWVLVIEATLPNSQVSNHGAWEFMLTEHAYRFAYFDGLNRYYVAEEHAELAAALTTPPNVFDEFQTVAQAKAFEAIHLAEARAREAEARAQDVDRQLAAMKRSLSWRLTRPLRWMREARARAAEAEAKAAEDKAHDAESKAQEAEAKAHAAEVEAREAESKAREAETRAQQLQALVNAMSHQLQDVYSSTSWKITTPLRKAGRVVINGKELARQVTVSPRASARRYGGALVRRIVPLVRRSPFLTEFAWRIYGRYPVIGEYMLRHVKSSGSADAADLSIDELSALSDMPSAWTQSTSLTSHFKTMLSRELRRRETSGGEVQ
jgi:FkbM family methyltransferase